MTNVERPRIIVGNWKMNLGGDQAREWSERLLSQVEVTADTAQLAVLPPFTAIHHFQTLRGGGGHIPYGAQDVSAYDDGALTGDISGSMLAELGCRYVLAGHSERREHHAETDADVNAKIHAAIRHGLTVILCVGEGLDVRQRGEHVRHTLAQLRAALDHVAPDAVASMLIAYEPVWAIGTGHVATPQDAQEVCSAIRQSLAEHLGTSTAERTRILYGGSVKASSTAAITAQPDIDGALVGGASLDPDELAAIWRNA